MICVRDRATNRRKTTQQQTALSETQLSLVSWPLRLEYSRWSTAGKGLRGRPPRCCSADVPRMVSLRVAIPCLAVGRPLRRLGVVPLLRLIATTAYLEGRINRCLLVVFALWAARSTRSAAQQATHHDQDACATDKKAAAKGREDHRRKLKRVRERLKHCLHAACSGSRAGRGDVWRNRRQHSWRRVDAHRGRKRRSIIVCHLHNIFGWRRRRWWRWRWRHSREEYCRGRLKDDSWRW